MAKVKQSAVADLTAQIDAITAKPDELAPGIVYVAVNKNGDTIFEHASGKSGLGRPEDMTLDHSFWIASCTKMITGIACMQLVEQGKLALDDVGLVEKLAPVRPSLRPVGQHVFWYKFIQIYSELISTVGIERGSGL